MAGEELGERAREVLGAIIHEYIRNGQPVASGALLRANGFDVSAATLRNVMADLEALGYLGKPHTSAGRIPTDRGYRFYVDTLVRMREPLPKERQMIEAGLSAEGTPALEEAGRMLHALSHCAGLVLAPRPSGAALERIEFIRLREDRVLAILVGAGGEVQNRAFTVDFPITPEELTRASNYLSELLANAPLEEVRSRIAAERAQEQSRWDALVAKSLDLGWAASAPLAEDPVRIQGTGAMLEGDEFQDVMRIRAILRALEEKSQLVALLDRVCAAKELQIFIGTENPLTSAGEVTVIASPYGSGGRALGAVGVIGPMRMNYQRLIPLVSFTAQVLGRVLET